MKEKLYTVEALSIAYEAIEQQIKYVTQSYSRNEATGEYEYVVIPDSELTDDEKVKVKAYRNALRMIEKIA